MVAVRQLRARLNPDRLARLFHTGKNVDNEQVVILAICEKMDSRLFIGGGELEL